MTSDAQLPLEAEHQHMFLGSEHSANERKAWAVIALCSAMMLIEIGGGITFGSLALVADGLHMSTHAIAMLIAALASTFARKHAADGRFSFGTGKIGDLAGFSSAIVLALIALLIGYEAVVRFLAPVPISFREAIPIACLGLIVNVVSAWLLSGGDDRYHLAARCIDTTHGHDHGHGAAWLTPTVKTWTADSEPQRPLKLRKPKDRRDSGCGSPALTNIPRARCRSRSRRGGPTVNAAANSRSPGAVVISSPWKSFRSRTNLLPAWRHWVQVRMPTTHGRLPLRKPARSCRSRRSPGSHQFARGLHSRGSRCRGIGARHPWPHGRPVPGLDLDGSHDGHRRRSGDLRLGLRTGARHGSNPPRHDARLGAPRPHSAPRRGGRRSASPTCTPVALLGPDIWGAIVTIVTQGRAIRPIATGRSSNASQLSPTSRWKSPTGRRRSLGNLLLGL